MENSLGINGIGDAISICLSASTIESVQESMRQAALEGSQLYLYRSPKQDGMKLDITGLNRILEIDSANLVAEVEAGVKIRELNAALDERGLRFIPGDNPFYADMTVGEFFHEGCPNIASYKYGFAKHFLMGSKIVIPTGEVLATGGKTVKNVTGYDFTRFFNGPYSDMGVTVSFLLKLLPKAERTMSRLAEFSDMEAVLKFAEMLNGEKIVPAIVYWLDNSIRSMLSDKGNDEKHAVIIQLDGVTEEVEEQWQKIAALLRTLGVTETVELPGDLGGHIDIRELFRPVRGNSLVDEFKFGFSEIRRFVGGYTKIAEVMGIKAGLFGQIAEGKINVYFKEYPDEYCRELISKLMSMAAETGGYVSGKYFRKVGLGGNSPLDSIEQVIKNRLDPNRIFGG